MAYQQPTFQNAVSQPVVVQPVQPIVVPVTSLGNRYAQGVKVGGHTIHPICTMFICFFGPAFLFMGSMMVITALSMRDHWGGNPPQYFPGIILVTLGVIFSVITCFLCVIHKKNKDEQRRTEYTAPYSEPFTDTGAGTGNIYTGQGQTTSTIGPTIGPTVGSTVYVPVQQPGVPSQPDMPYPNMPAPGGAPMPMPYNGPPNSVPEKGHTPEYDQQSPYAPVAPPPTYAPVASPPAYAPPGYSP